MIKVENVSYKYADGYEAIKNLSFNINKGESIGLIGSNGAGKSTLLMLLVGLLLSKDGEIKISDIKINKKNLEKIREKIGLIFQNSEDQVFMTKVYEEVAFGPRNCKLKEEEVTKVVTKALKEVGIEELREKITFKLSGGEKKLVAIASILSMNPEIVIMDEPTAALDPKARRRLINILNEMDYTKIIASHDLDMILETCTKVIVMKKGELAQIGNAKDILTNQEFLESCGLELPLCYQKPNIKQM